MEVFEAIDLIACVNSEGNAIQTHIAHSAGETLGMEHFIESSQNLA